MTGAEAALRQLFTTYYGQVVRFVERRVHDHEAAEDIATDTFRVTWEKFEELDQPDIAWLIAVARNKIRDHNKQLARRLRTQERVMAEEAIALANDEPIERLIVRDIVAALPEPQREMVVLFYWEDRTAAEIAQHFGRSVQSVWTMLSRTRDKLRDLLTDVDEAENGRYSRERST